MIKGSGKDNIVLPNNTRLSIKDALYSPESRRNLLSFKDIRANVYHIETKDEVLQQLQQNLSSTVPKLNNSSIRF